MFSILGSLALRFIAAIEATRPTPEVLRTYTTVYRFETVEKEG